MVKASLLVTRLTQLVAEGGGRGGERDGPLKHIAQLLGTHTHTTWPYLYTHNIWLTKFMLLFVWQPTAVLGLRLELALPLAGEGLPYYLHIYYIHTHIFGVCVRERER